LEQSADNWNMKISSANSHAHAMQASATKPSTPTTQIGGQASGARMTINSSSATQVGGAADQGTGNLSPQERLANYAAHMEERLNLLEERGAESGMDLSEVRSNFRDHITRLQDAMANGLQGDDLARGIENTSNLVRDGVREAIGLPNLRNPNITKDSGGVTSTEVDLSTNIDIEHSNERLDAIEKRISERLDSLFDAGEAADKKMVIGAREQFSGHMDRLRDALATGNMSHEDMQRSMENIMMHLEDNLDSGDTHALTSGGNGNSAVTDGGNAVAASAVEKGMPGTTSVAEARAESRLQVLSLLTKDIKASGAETFQPALSDLLKPGSPVGDFLVQMREASQKAKGGGAEGYTPAALKATLISADLPGSSLNYKV
jgi:hypothetical protein